MLEANQLGSVADLAKGVTMDDYPPIRMGENLK